MAQQEEQSLLNILNDDSSPYCVDVSPIPITDENITFGQDFSIKTKTCKYILVNYKENEGYNIYKFNIINNIKNSLIATISKKEFNRLIDEKRVFMGHIKCITNNDNNSNEGGARSKRNKRRATCNKKRRNKHSTKRSKKRRYSRRK